jgi:nucleoside-diphosphate-sugar epimerase
LTVGAKLLVLGIDGFIGESVWEFFFNQLPCVGLTFEQFVATKKDSFQEYLRHHRPTILFNALGSGTTQHQLAPSIDANVGIVAGLVDDLKAAEVDLTKFILLGSAAEYGFSQPHLRPVSAYGISKRLQFELFRDISFNKPNLNPVYLRAYNVIGPRVPNVTLVGGLRQRIFEAARTGANFILDDWDLQRDFVDISDLCSAVQLIIQSPKTSGKEYEIASGHSIPIIDLARAYAAALPSHLQVEVIRGKPHRHRIASIAGAPQQLTRDTGWRPEVDLQAACRLAMEHLCRDYL